MIAFWIFLFVLISQRLIELLIAKRNERILKAQGGIEFDKNGYRVIVVMHVAFFVSLISEKVFLHRTLNTYWFVFAVLFVGAQFLRYWAIKSLGVYWNTKILVLPNHQLINGGPYKYLRHPNYIAVIVEIAVIPLLFSCYITAIVVSVINLLLLNRRVRIEEMVLYRIW